MCRAAKVLSPVASLSCRRVKKLRSYLRSVLPKTQFVRHGWAVVKHYELNRVSDLHLDIGDGLRAPRQRSQRRAAFQAGKTDGQMCFSAFSGVAGVELELDMVNMVWRDAVVDA